MSKNSLDNIKNHILSLKLLQLHNNNSIDCIILIWFMYKVCSHKAQGANCLALCFDAKPNFTVSVPVLNHSKLRMF